MVTKWTKGRHKLIFIQLKQKVYKLWISYDRAALGDRLVRLCCHAGPDNDKYHLYEMHANFVLRWTAFQKSDIFDCKLV